MSAVDDVRDEDEGRSLAKWLIPAVGLLVMAALVYWAITSFNSGAGHKKPAAAKIALLPDTAPPPPPPPPEKKPEPEVKEEKPQPQQDEAPKPQDKPPEAEAIKMEGAAGDGPSAFGAGSVNKEFTIGEPNTGTGGAANKLQFTLYGKRAANHVQSELAKLKELKGLDYRLNVRLWLSADGGVQKVELVSSTGDEARDALLRQAIAHIPPLSEQPPPSMPQPMSLRITNRVTG
jgi:protein TonB